MSRRIHLPIPSAALALSALLALAALIALGSLPAFAETSPTLPIRPTPLPGAAAPDLCQWRVMDNYRNTVVFGCPDGALAIYRLDGGNGRFHAWVDRETWSGTAPGAAALDLADDTGYRYTLTRLAAADVPASAGAMWFQITLRGPGGQVISQDMFSVNP